MKHLFAALLFLVSMNLAYSSNYENALKAFTELADDEFQKLSLRDDRNQSLVDKTRYLLKKPFTNVPLENFEGIDTILYAINNQYLALTIALANRGVPLFITDRNSKLASPLVFALSKFQAPEFNVLLQCAINRQGYYINQLDNYGMSLLLHLFKLPNFTPSIEMIELLVVTFKADVDDKCQYAARVKLPFFNPKDRPRVIELMDRQSQPTVQSASPAEISALNERIKNIHQKGQIEKDPRDVLATQIRLRLARKKRTTRGKSNAPHSVNDLSIHDLVDTIGALINAEQSNNPIAIAVALADKKHAFEAAITEAEAEEAAYNRSKTIKCLKEKFDAEKNALNKIQSE